MYQRDWAKSPMPGPKPAEPIYTYVVKEAAGIGVPIPRPDRSSHRAAADFPVGTRVRIVCRTQDFMYFGSGDEPGVVIANQDRYLGIIVKFDKIHIFHNDDGFPECGSFRCSKPTHQGRIMEDFNFQPDDLAIEDSLRSDE